MENNANDFNAGATDPSAATTDYGSNSANDGQPSGDPGNQSGQQTDPRDAELAKYREETRRLNQALVEARRASNSNPQSQQPQDPNGDNQNDPAYQYGVGLKVATGELRGKLESILDLYPELPANIQSQIRRNPWGYAKEDSMLALNVDNGLLDVETWIADYVAALEGQNGAQSAEQTTPARVNQNQPADPAGNSQPDPMEDWALPMDQLEQKVGKIKSANAARS